MIMIYYSHGLMCLYLLYLAIDDDGGGGGDDDDDALNVDDVMNTEKKKQWQQKQQNDGKLVIQTFLSPSFLCKQNKTQNYENEMSEVLVKYLLSFEKF